MKKYLIFAATTLMLAAVSCSKEPAPIEEPEQAQPTVQKISFTAVADNAPETRTILADREIKWAAHETIYVFDGTAPRMFTSTNTEEATVVTFEGEASTEPQTYTAVFPFATMTGSTINVTIPVYQTATANSFDPKANIAVAVAPKTPDLDLAQMTLQFKNAAAVVKFKLSNSDVTKVRLDAINGEKMAGNAAITLDSGNLPGITMADDAQSCVVLKPASGTFATGTEYAIAVAPGTYSGGFRITLFKADGKFKSLSNTTEQTLKRNGLMDFGEIPAVSNWKESEQLYSDEITYSLIGVVGQNYNDWSGKSCTNSNHSSAVYAGQTAGQYESVQMRSKNSNSGIISTTSGGKVKSVTVIWNSGTTNGNSVDVYGSNSAYTSPTELYSNSNTQGTKLGSIVCGTSTSLTVSGDYTYIGLRSKSGAIYLDKITIVWASSGESAPSDPSITPNTFIVTPPASTIIPATGGSSSFTINSNIPWTISLDNEGVASYSTSQNGSITTVSVSMSAISSGSRSATFTVTPSEGTPQAVTFTQTTSSVVEFIAGTDTGETSVTKDGITVSMSTMSRTDNYRAYKGTDMVVSAAEGKTIKSIVLTATAESQSEYGPGCFSKKNTQPGSYTFEGKIGTWSGSASSVALTASLAQVRMTKIVVEYSN